MKNGVTTSLLFFLFENAKNLGRSDDGKRRKKKRMAALQRKHDNNIFPTMYANASEGKQNLFFFAFLHVVPFCYTEPFYPVNLRPNFALFMRRTNFSGLGS